jgi:hypothetical protein
VHLRDGRARASRRAPPHPPPARTSRWAQGPHLGHTCGGMASEGPPRKPRTARLSTCRLGTQEGPLCTVGKAGKKSRAPCSREEGGMASADHGGGRCEILSCCCALGAWGCGCSCPGCEPEPKQVMERDWGSPLTCGVRPEAPWQPGNQAELLPPARPHPGVCSWDVDPGVCSLDEQLKVFVSRHSATFSSIVKGETGSPLGSSLGRGRCVCGMVEGPGQ